MKTPQPVQPKLSPIVPIERLDDVKDFLQEGKVVFDSHQYIWDLVGGNVMVGTIHRAGHSMYVNPDIQITFRDFNRTREILGKLEVLAASKGLRFKYDSYTDTEGLGNTFYRLEKA